MATVHYEDGNQVFRYFSFNYYSAVSESDTELLLEYSGPRDYDPGENPWNIVLTFEDAASEVIADGEHAGTTVYTAGNITSISFYDQSLNTLIVIDDLAVALSSYSDALLSGDLDRFYYDYVVNDGASFFGSEDASGAEDGDTGDSIATGLGDDLVKAMGGDDLIKDFGGSDTYKGGKGVDMITYSLGPWWDPYTDGIRANLREGFIIGSDGNTDQVFSIEDVRGTMYEDRIAGNKRDNTFVGEGGEDIFIGRGGSDWVSYRYDASSGGGGTNGVTVNLAAGEAYDGWGDRDKLRTIENATGTNYSDTFIDDDKDNSFEGRSGSDTFYLSGGTDTVDGGNGADTFIFQGNAFGTDTVSDFRRSQDDQVIIENANSFGEFSITQDGDDAWVQWNGNTVILVDTSAGSLTAADFGFA